ncbi:hypothetical protein EIP91_009179 [Steccherinum ochraceum]|uniref:PIN domain-containing protein n=1 Tax=Steccherinum ochraceum TaxID=92696 RepID=A0A4R0RA29_9APHY|nr:hypothetical protein EIP91_009179 [Steccherinum ochraceum]
MAAAVSAATATMADKKGPIATPNRLAMSRALGAAFLNHQVEQLEKSVSSKNSNGAWRERRYPSPQSNADSMRGVRNAYPPKSRTPSGGSPKLTKNTADDFPPLEKQVEVVRKDVGKVDRENLKDADVIVVDASVLVHAIGQLKKWARDGREEVVIVPLEALNTLDLLKKGTSTLAQRARTASRILEAQVGVNPRIRVQRDDAFVLWDNIPFKDLPSGTTAASCPEWIRRTICCARWEAEHATEEVKDRNTDAEKPTLRVLLAVLSSPPDAALLEASSGAPVTASPVPLPAPQPNKFEPRCAGTLISQWAARSGVEVLEIPATQSPPPSAPKDIPVSNRRLAEHGRRSGDAGRRSPEDKRTGAGRGRRNSHLRPGERGATPPGGGLVERPPAVMAMMEAVAQPSRVVRVLARGEKLDP